ncbi:MAG: GTP cyclohydrolase I [Bradymonadaceae bacterium]
MSDEPIEHARALLTSLGLDPEDDPEYTETPERFVDLLRDRFAGLDSDPPELTTFESAEGESEPVLVQQLSFHSMCMHHVVPFFGRIDVAYLPADRMTGFGSIDRTVDHFSRRPQLQERLVEQIAAHLADQLEPRGVLVRCIARQLCFELAGSGRSGRFVSTAARGELTHGRRRQEIFDRLDDSTVDPT